MNRYSLIAFVALLVVVAALPVYAWLEPNRMERAQRAFYDEYAADGVLTYVESCADCHGPMGEGTGGVPPLNNPGLAEADRWILYDTIARAPHGTAMSAWHIGEGGTLSGYEVEGLVTLIQSGEWMRVGALTLPGPMPLPTPAPFAELMALELSEEMDPHECRACHEEPAVHAERFGLDCARCHTLQAWKPALLLRHVFFLDHGQEGQVACQTCHTATYAENTCYECHDHEPADMQVAHAREDITDFEACAKCHPTGQQGEAARLGYGRSGEANRGQPVGGGLAPHDEPAASPSGD